ncbi:DUF3291 domain-containing protein [Deinococcus hopiensis]|uniref:DUF3291 domain-containing protein n=1 Tax=Deinococcus hopiensis KR-140 TaxID=695939 RepID=A0A1W1V9Z3_9DEIO|nr:DUF3291 domain-containing protein [Deinococcus hopiensis]SMB90063.1 protein of unknown function [Deinococcus hopiensis KR-140]
MKMQLAQVNVARLRAPELADFIAGLDPVSALAEAAPGFVWRLQDEGGNATNIPYDPDPLLIVNLSVWEDVEAVRAFASSGVHLDFLKRWREWFTRMAQPDTAMWGVAAGKRPTAAQAKSRLAQLEAQGPTAHAFTFAAPFGPDGLPRTSGPITSRAEPNGTSSIPAAAAPGGPAVPDPA